jgi:hypothetical protein
MPCPCGDLRVPASKDEILIGFSLTTCWARIQRESLKISLPWQQGWFHPAFVTEAGYRGV